MRVKLAFHRCAACLSAVLLTAVVYAVEDNPAREVIEGRLKPFGKVCLKGEDCGVAASAVVVRSETRSGIDIYNKHCSVCHATGVSDAPLVGAETWNPRIEKGYDVLLQNTRNGFNNNLMPLMGTCMDCSDGELRSAIDYMIKGE